MQEQALGRQIEAAKRRAMQHCKDYDSNNAHWKIVDEILCEQQSINQLLRDQSALMRKHATIIIDATQKDGEKKISSAMSKQGNAHIAVSGKVIVDIDKDDESNTSSVSN